MQNLFCGKRLINQRRNGFEFESGGRGVVLPDPYSLAWLISIYMFKPEGDKLSAAKDWQIHISQENDNQKMTGMKIWDLTSQRRFLGIFLKLSIQHHRGSVHKARQSKGVSLQDGRLSKLLRITPCGVKELFLFLLKIVTDNSWC